MQGACSTRDYVPGLAVILVGEVPASQIYVRSKVKTCGELGIYSEMLTPPESDDDRGDAGAGGRS